MLDSLILGAVPQNSTTAPPSLPGRDVLQARKWLVGIGAKEERRMDISTPIGLDRIAPTTFEVSEIQSSLGDRLSASGKYNPGRRTPLHSLKCLPVAR